MSFPRKAEEDLKAIENRGVSHTTGIICANCGNKAKISNRHKLPWHVMNLDNGLCTIFFNCPKCNDEYDIGTCIIK